jgi:hypothetical protein
MTFRKRTTMATELATIEASPFNLSDVVPFRAVQPAATVPSQAVKQAQDWEERSATALKMKNMVAALEDRRSGSYVPGEWDAMNAIHTRWRDKAHNAAMQVLATEGMVPDTLRSSEPVIRLSGLPTVNMEELRQVVDVLDMVIMPWEYMKPSAYEKESSELRSAIKQFVEDSKGAFNVCVAAPVQYYDTSRHVAAEEDHPIFAGRHVAPAFLAMGMALPMFRAISRDLAAVRDRTNAHSQRIQQAEQQIQQLDSRVTQLQAQVERQQAEQIQQNLRQAKMETELRASAARSSFMAYDPMMVAIPKGRSVLDNGHAIVGPCWGPDFDAIVMTALGLRKYKGQRETLKAAIKTLDQGPVRAKDPGTSRAPYWGTDLR